MAYHPVGEKLDFSFEDIVQALRNTELTPEQLSEYRLWLSGEFSFHADKLQKILIIKPEDWMKMRSTVRSDRQADKLWSMSPAGKEEMALQFRLKSIEKMMSAIKSRLEILNAQAYNLY